MKASAPLALEPAAPPLARAADYLALVRPRMAMMILVTVLLGGLLAVVLLALPRIKGGWIGLMYALQVTRKDAALHTADAAD